MKINKVRWVQKDYEFYSVLEVPLYKVIAQLKNVDCMDLLMLVGLWESYVPPAIIGSARETLIHVDVGNPIHVLLGFNTKLTSNL